MHPVSSTPEQNLVDGLRNSQTTLGHGIPRLFTQKPQIAMNAIKNQFTGQNLFMPPTELADDLRLGMDTLALLGPMGSNEIQIAQRLIDANWQLNRAMALGPIMLNARIAEASRSFNAAHPDESEDTILVNAQALAADKAYLDLAEKHSRTVKRMDRLLRNTRKDYNAFRGNRISKRGNQYNTETCPAYAWYKKLVDLADRLIEARQELKAKITPVAAVAETVTHPESTTSATPLFCEKTFLLVTPLTPEAAETFDVAREIGLLSSAELELLIQPNAA